MEDLFKQDLCVAPIFSNHMVLQHGMPIKIWGKGPEGYAITLTIQDQTVHTTVRDGTWQVTLHPLTPGGPFILEVFTATEKITLYDVLIGDVYLASGQSNMAMPLREVEGGLEEIATAQYPQIRVCDMVAKRYPEETTHLGGDDEVGWEVNSTDLVWKPAQGAAIKNFSAVGYFFTKEIHSTQNIPIGIVGCSWGGKSASCWIREAYFQKDSELKSFYKSFQKRLKSIDLIDYTKAYAEYALNLQRIVNRLTEEWIPEPFGPLSSEIPCNLYKGMLSRLIPFSFKAVIWYQGESDELNHALYEKMFTALINNWRDDFEAPDLPFFFVQLPSYKTDASPDPHLWGYLREAQYKVSKKIPHTYMAVTTDLGNSDDIHPTRKREVGHRLALLARKHLYGENIIAHSPTLKAATYENSQIKLYFDHVGEGLIIKGDTLVGLKIKDSTDLYRSIQGTVHGNYLKIDHSSLTNLKEICFAFESNTTANLYNSVGLPVTPFRMNCSK